MQNLISITQSSIGNEEVNSVNLRDVWKFVESKQEFAAWAKRRLERAGKGVDFTSFDKVIKREAGATIRREYLVSLDYAKMICMLENNEKGDELRRYFVDCEKKLLSKAEKPALPQNYLEALKALVISEEQKVALSEENKQLEAKVKGYQRWVPLAQFVNMEQIDTHGISMNPLVTQLRKINPGAAKKIAREGQPYPVWHFDPVFLAENLMTIEQFLGDKLSSEPSIFNLY